MKRLSRIASILTAVSVILVACSQPAQIVTTQVAVTQIVTTQVVTTQIVTTQVAANTAETPATEPAPAKTSLVFAVSGGASAAENLLDPTMDTGAGARFSAVNNIYDPLVLWDVATNQFVPRLALTWEQVQTNTVRFTLRPDVTFQNGSAFTAEDVAFTFNRTLDPSTGGTSRTLFSALQRAEVVDPLTVDLIGQPATILYLADTMLIVDQETYEEIGAAEYNLHPVGTGPYSVAAWEPGHSITLQANPTYWDGAPSIESVGSSRVDLQACKLEYSIVSPK